MAKHKIAWLPGDGIGIEVLQAANIVLDAASLDADFLPGDIGWEFWREEGDALPTRTIDLLKRVDAAMFGAITSKPAKAAESDLVPELQNKGLVYRSPIVRMRQLFDLFVCLRPCKAYPGNSLNYKPGIDLVVFRENTEDLYAGLEHEVVPGVVESLKIITATASERIATFAFEYARKHGRKRVTAIHKANIMKMADGLFLKSVAKIATSYPDIVCDDRIIDAACMHLVMNPTQFDILLLTNLYGDIVSDLCAGLVGGLGVVPSANLGTEIGVFEAVHGSAPDIAGKNLANPTALLLSALLMLRHIGEGVMADRIMTALGAVLSEGKIRTRDLGGSAGTREFADAICARLAG